MRTIIGLSVLVLYVGKARAWECQDRPCPEIQKGYSKHELAFLSQHNRYRRKHINTPCLQLDSSLSAMATIWAKSLRDRNTFSRDLQDTHGENLYKYSMYQSDGPPYWTEEQIKTEVKKAVDSWYREQKYYDYSTTRQKYGYSRKMVGHFTQMVWASTSRLGLGYATTVENGWYMIYVVGRYDPRGNFDPYGRRRRTPWNQNVQPAECPEIRGVSAEKKDDSADWWEDNTSDMGRRRTGNYRRYLGAVAQARCSGGVLDTGSAFVTLLGLVIYHTLAS